MLEMPCFSRFCITVLINFYNLLIFSEINVKCSFEDNTVLAIGHLTKNSVFYKFCMRMVTIRKRKDGNRQLKKFYVDEKSAVNCNS
jgi:hypothetical protein